MKEATGEGSMTIVTIIVIVSLAAAAAIVIGVMANTAKGEAEGAKSTGYNCEDNGGTIKCTQKTTS